MGQFGSGLPPRGSPGALAVSPEEVADRRARHRALLSDVWLVVCPEGIANTTVSEWGVALAEAAAVVASDII